MAGDEQGFEAIYTAYAGRIEHFLLRLTGDASLSEELTQETFVQAYSSLHRFRGECGMYTWLAAIARNVYLHELRRSRREMLNAQVVLEELSAPEEEEPGWRLCRESDIALVRQAIRALPEKYAEVLMLRIYAGLSYDEIAKKLRISVSSAKVLCFRAKNKIREAIEHDRL